MFKTILYFSTIQLLTSCIQNNHSFEKVPIESNKIDTGFFDSFKIAKIDTLRPEGLIKLKNIRTINILSLRKTITNDSIDNKFYNSCNTWKLNQKDIKTLFRYLTPIDRHKFNYEYYVLPCEYKGEVELDSQKFSYTINAGSFMKLINSDTTMIYGCESKSCKEFFLVESEIPY